MTAKNLSEEKAFQAIVKYMKSIGWDVATGNFESIERETLSPFPKNRFRLVFSFIGKKIKR